MLTALVEPCVASPSVVAAIPRGGLAVAVPIAARLRAPLTLVFARKLTVPSAPEFAIGAVDEDGTLLLDHAHAESVGATSEELDRARRGAQAEIERERAHYSAVPLAKLARGAAVVLVDDGLATGLTMRAAIAYARRCGARAVIVGVDVGGAPVATGGGPRARADRGAGIVRRRRLLRGLPPGQRCRGDRDPRTLTRERVGLSGRYRAPVSAAAGIPTPSPSWYSARTRASLPASCQAPIA